eukprot:jgi/Chlat1/3133/Chrsp21S08800
MEASAPTHPLDMLTPAEISAAIAAFRTSDYNSEGVFFSEIMLEDPPKEVVGEADARLMSAKLQGRPAELYVPVRRARLTVYNKLINQTVVAIARITWEALNAHALIESAQVIPNVQPPMDAEEYPLIESIVKMYPPFQEAMNRRGITDMANVMVDPWCMGYFTPDDGPARRKAWALLFLRRPGTPSDNGYACPIEGVHVTVDLQDMKVIRFEDKELVSLPPPDPLRNFWLGDRPLRTDVKPIVIRRVRQPRGPSYHVNGNYVEWQKWSFRVGFTPKEGLVLYSLAYDDDERGRRSIAHRLSFVEMVVPYGDPEHPHYRKNAFDAGEDGLGKNAHSLKLGCDCLGVIHYFDAHLSDYYGNVRTIENAVCLHEEDNGILWKHMAAKCHGHTYTYEQDWRTALTDVRRARRLVISFICTIANYEYGFFWYLNQDGTVNAEVKLTGVLSIGAIRPGETRKYGSRIAEGLYAPVHQHFFVARLDMAIDSNRSGDYARGHNSVVEVNVETESPGPHNPHANAFFATETLLKTELEAIRDCNPASVRFWEVRNTHAKNRVGHATGWRLLPGSNCLPFGSPDAKVFRRAAFLSHNLWVTRYHPDEKFPGGDFPNQCEAIGDGLPTWTKQNRDLVDTDVVLWYVFGITHVPRLEDWPVMPVDRIGFTLMPHGFFDNSPAIDVPPGNASSCHQSKL